MIEQAMLFSLGFLLAALLALAIAPAFWHRAIRLATRRLEMQLPLSAREVLAGRDLLRAEFAVEHRRLEQKIGMLSELHARDMAELGHRAHELAAKDADLQLSVSACKSISSSVRRFDVAWPNPGRSSARRPWRSMM